MKGKNFKSDRHTIYGQRKRDKARARRKDYVKDRNMKHYGQKHDDILELRTPTPILRFRAGGMPVRKAA